MTTQEDLKTRTQKAKQWIVDHQDAIVVVTVIGAVVTGMIFGTRAQLKYQARALAIQDTQIGQLNALLDLERIAGRPLYPVS